MSIVVREVVLSTAPSSTTLDGSRNLTLTVTPNVGDVVLLKITSVNSTARTVSSVTGLGATWSALFSGARTAYWIGTGATSSGSPTVTMSGSGICQANMFLLSGVGTTGTGGEVTTTGLSTTGPSATGTSGQFVVVGVGVASTNDTWPSTLDPTTDWTTQTRVTAASAAFNTSYRTPTSSVSHRADLTLSSGSSSVRSLTVFVLDAPAAAPTMTLAGDLQRKTAAVTLFAGADLHITADLQRKTASFTAFANASMTLAGDLQRKTASFTLDAQPIATLAGTLRPKTAAFTVNIEDAVAEVELAGTLQPKTGSFTLDAAAMLALAGDLQRKTASITTFAGADATLAGTLQAKTATFEVSTLERPVRIQGTLRRKTAAITLKIPPYILLAGTLRAKTGAFELAKPPVTDFTNGASGLDLGGYGIATWEPAVIELPAALAPVHDYNVARVYTAPTLVDGRPVDLVTATARKPRLRDRVLVNGKDITYWRGIQTPTPAYQLIDPLLYGPGRLSLPQVSLAFGEQVGVGDLTWLKPDAIVKVQRVDPETNAVVTTDYIGIITRFDVDGNTLVCELGGLVAGYAQDMERQAVIFRKVKDAGNWVYSAVTQAAPVAFTPRLGPNTGIDLVSIGGMGHLDWINTLCSLSVTDDGQQYTVGRRDDGTWGMWLKDLETVHATVYFDDADMKPSLVRDTSEEPTGVYAFGLNEDGQRINFAVYPGLRQGEPAPYPFGSGETFDEGTTDADTDDPSAGLIVAMLNMMVTVGLISSAQNTGVYNAAVTRAVKDIQDAAGMAETGVMNPATWNALWDLSVVGYSLANSRYEPAAQRSSTKKYLLSSSGAIIGRNPAYQPRKRKVHRTIQAGSGMTGRPQLRKMARAKLGTENNWVGSFTANLALIAGEHIPGDPIDPADVMDPRDIKPGMNIWAPLWGGTAAAPGTLFHVPTVQVPEGGRTPTITIDTSASPSLEAWQRIQRNKESRMNLSRDWLRSNRSSQMSKDVKEWDSVCGWINDRVFCEGGRWTVIPVPAGQAGTISRLKIRTLNGKRRHAIAVFARSVKAAALNRRFPAPLTEAGTEKWDKPAMVTWLENRGRVFVAGGYHQAGGYFPGKEWEDQSDEPTGDPITGVSDTEASFGYHTFAEPVLYVAVWVEADCWISAGRIMWGQLEAGS